MAKEPVDEIQALDGPIAAEFPELAKSVSDEGLEDYLHDFHDTMRELSCLPTPDMPSFEQPDISPEEFGNVIEAVDFALDGLSDEIEEAGLSDSEVRNIKIAATRRVTDFLLGSEEEFEAIRDDRIPENLRAIPEFSAFDDNLLIFDKSGTNVAFMSLPLAATSQLSTKVLIIAGIILAIISWLLGILGIKVPDVKADKLGPSVSRALRNPTIRRLFLDMMEILKREGATIGEKIKAILAFLKVLYDGGHLRTILGQILSSMGFIDLMITIAALIALVFSGGASVAAKAALATAGLILSLIKLGEAYHQSQRA